MRTVFFWVITQPVVVIPYRRSGTTIENGTAVCPEALVMNYHYWLRNNSEERASKSCVGKFISWWFKDVYDITFF